MPGPEPTAHTPEPDRTGDAVDAGGEPRAVGGYRLLRRVGEGGMSTVYQSYDVTAGRSVAVKVLADHLAGQQEFINRFYREVRLSQLLRHPHVVQGYAAGYDPDAKKHYLVLEFIDGPSAHAALTRLGRVPVGIAVRIGLDIAHALDFLHRKNYVHRDVKPDNILLHPDGVAKLADLGLAKRLSDDSHLTAVNLGVGTSYYMPYEQAMNPVLVDGRSDIFALGATLYHLLTGDVPFPGTTHEEIVKGKETNAYRPARDVNPDIPASLDVVLSGMLARDPRHRYQDAAELIAVLEATRLATRIPSFAPGAPVPVDAPRPDCPTRVDLPTDTPTDETEPLPPKPPSTPRLIPVVLALILAAAGALAVAAHAGPAEAVTGTPAVPPGSPAPPGSP